MNNVILTAEHLGLVNPELQLWFIEEVFKGHEEKSPSVVIDLDTWQRRVDNMAELLRESWNKSIQEMVENTRVQFEGAGLGAVPADSGDAAEAGGEDGEDGGGALEPVPETRERA